MKQWWPQHWVEARTVRRISAALLLLALSAQGQGGWIVSKGERVALSRQDMARFQPFSRYWNFFPSGGAAAPSPKGKGLEGLLARRVRPGKVHYDPGAGARTYPLKVVTRPGGKVRFLLRERILRLFSSPGGKSWLVSFERTLLPMGKGKLKVWRARLAEGLSFEGLGGRKGLLLDGDGDGYFRSFGKDLLLLEEKKARRFLPLTAVALFQTGAYDLAVDEEDRVSWRVHRGPMGLLEVRALLSGSGRILSAVVGTGKAFRLVKGSTPVVPAVPGKWFLFWGKVSGGLAFHVPYPDRSSPGLKKGKLFSPPNPPREGKMFARVKQGKRAVLTFGAPLTVEFSMRDMKDTLVLENPVIRGSLGEIYRPDRETFGKGEIPLLLVIPLVGRGSRQRRKSPLPWIPWSPGGKRGFLPQRMVLSVAETWAPLYLRVVLRRGPLSGAVGFQRVR